MRRGVREDGIDGGKGRVRTNELIGKTRESG